MTMIGVLLQYKLLKSMINNDDCNRTSHIVNIDNPLNGDVIRIGISFILLQTSI